MVAVAIVLFWGYKRLPSAGKDLGKATKALRAGYEETETENP